ncbi:ras suppressor protein 1 isoform X4 [Syngnathoides biaculeatus]|uniref:ras suppressor protein 1 isoform X4 n=1 Tax=Syngnathoides biaculeatus TaxID=300417 RepID=UPI002ADDA482|nr:ras suppressor protein 1 isoform X4 [Syngnathoides biaculeatus]
MLIFVPTIDVTSVALLFLIRAPEMSKSLKKIVDESREKNLPDVEMCDRGISNMLDIPGLFTLSHITQLVLSHNKLTVVPANISELKNLEVLNMFNNQIEELPTQMSSLQKLKHLNLGMNRLYNLPRGFGSLPALEVLDLTYNNLTQNSLPGNFFYLTTLRALYLSDNDFEILPSDIGKMTKLQILSLRDNDLISLPKDIGELGQLKELHIQGNRLTVLPPELDWEYRCITCIITGGVLDESNISGSSAPRPGWEMTNGIFLSRVSMADTCRPTQNRQRRATTRVRRSAANHWQPKTNKNHSWDTL